MLLALFLSLLLFVQNDVPFKAKEEFEIRLDYQFKERGQYSSTTKSVLPYVTMKLKLLKLNNEEKLKIDTDMQANFLVRRHIEIGEEYRIDLGFTSDVKDHVSANEYTITLLSPEKKPISKIVIRVESDGTFKVNGETRGKF